MHLLFSPVLANFYYIGGGSVGALLIIVVVVPGDGKLETTTKPKQIV